MSIEKLFSKRRQIRAAWDQKKIPTKKQVHNLLDRTLQISPSKQNLFPFKIHAYGPDNVEERETVGKICTLYQTGSVNHWDDAKTNGTIITNEGEFNINDLVIDDEGNDYRIAPWVLVFESRLCEPNNFVKEYSDLHNDYSRFSQTDPERFRDMCNTKLSCIEVGMYLQTLAGLCLENDIGISYIRSFPEWRWAGKRSEYNKDGNKHGNDWSTLPDITEQPLMVAQLGYVANRLDTFRSNSTNDGRGHWENKPDIDTIVQFKD